MASKNDLNGMFSQNNQNDPKGRTGPTTDRSWWRLCLGGLGPLFFSFAAKTRGRPFITKNANLGQRTNVIGITAVISTVSRYILK